MTNDQRPAVETSRPPGVGIGYEGVAAALVVIGFVLGILRAAGILAAGTGGMVLWIEAAYAFVLHVGAGLLVSVPIRAAGAWTGAEASRTVAAPVVGTAAPAEVAEVERRPEATDGEPRQPAAPALDGDRWRSLILAARDANDAARVLELRQEVPEDQDEEGLKELDVDLGKWFLSLVHRRLRSGPLQLDLVSLVEQVSGSFGHTKEGASLRAALPTLRRGAGLCPRCAKPYTGVWEACPECMGRPEPPPPILPGLVAAEVDDLEAPPVGERWFVDPDDEPGANGRARS